MATGLHLVYDKLELLHYLEEGFSDPGVAVGKLDAVFSRRATQAGTVAFDSTWLSLIPQVSHRHGTFGNFGLKASTRVTRKLLDFECRGCGSCCAHGCKRRH